MFKHFGLDGLHKETPALFLFTIYKLKSVFCKDNLVEYELDRWVEFLSGNTAEDEHALETRSQISPRFIAPGEIFAVEFVIIKHFA